MNAALSLCTVRSASVRWLVFRAVSVIPVLLVVTLITFFIIEVLPGNAAQQLLGLDGTQAQLNSLEAQLGLDRTAGERYLKWLTAAARGDLGVSLASGQPIAPLLIERSAVTLQLVAFAITLSILIAISAALLCARFPDTFLDRIILVLSMASLSVPNYVMAIILVLVFSVGLGLLPAIGFATASVDISRNILFLILPSIAIATPLAGMYARILRADLLQILRQEDYIVTAIAKGLSPWRVLTRHTLRNSLSGLVTIIGLNFGALLGGTVVIEHLFAIPGLGALLLQSVTLQDAPVVQGAIVLLGLATVIANLMSELLITVLDPRPTVET